MVTGRTPTASPRALGWSRILGALPSEIVRGPLEQLYLGVVRLPPFATIESRAIRWWGRR